MSGTFPTSPKVREIKIVSDQPTLNSLADSGKRQSRYAGGHLWELALTFPPMERATFEPINGFIMSQDGSFDEFDYVPPTKATPRGVWGSTVSVVGAHVAGDTSIDLDGFNPNASDIVKVGDVLRFFGHSKVYMVVENATSIGNAATLQIRPALIDSLLDNEQVTFTNVPFTVFVDDVLEHKVSRQGFYSHTVKLKESL